MSKKNVVKSTFDPCEIKDNAEIKANAGIYLTTNVVRLNQASLPASVYAFSFALTRRPDKTPRQGREEGLKMGSQRSQEFLEQLMVVRGMTDSGV